MRNLLRAGLRRLRRNAAFYLCLFSVLAVSFATALSMGIYSPLENGREFAMTPILGFAAAMFSVLFLSAEYVTARNKLICGCSRAGVYGANLLLCTFVSLLFAFAMLTGTLLGYAAVGDRGIAWDFCLRLSVCLLSTAALCALAVLPAFLLGNRAASMGAALFCMTGLLIAVAIIYGRLQEPE